MPNGRGRRTRRDFEREFQSAEATSGTCAFVGLDKSLEHIGAGRIEVDDTGWKSAIIKLMESARLIILVPVRNPGTLWEMDQIIEKDRMSKTLLINVPEQSKVFWIGPKFQQSDDWPVIQKRLADAGFVLPEFSNAGRSNFFGKLAQRPKTKRIRIPDRVHLKRMIKGTRTLN